MTVQIAETPKKQSLALRSARRMGLTLLVLGFLIFVPARSFHFWQAWLYLGLQTVSWSYLAIYFLKHDPQLAERRLQSKESEPQQKWALKLFSILLWTGFVLVGLDFRLAWSWRWFGGVPLALVLISQTVVVAGYVLVFWVMKTNTFAASIIRVEEGHRVINSGPYALVRHPMYTGMALTSVATPLALASYAALPVFALMIPVLAYRLIHEERMLRRDLTGYSQYCDRTRFRLVPGLW